MAGATGAFADVLAARNAICGYGAGTNPFDPLCNDHPSQNVNQQNFCGESREGYSSQKATDCAPLIARICAGANSVLTRVGAGEYNCSADDMFASDREVTCGATDPAGDPVCGLVIASVCTGANAFASTAGGGNYPCSTDSTFEGARDAYCRTTTTVGDSLCAGARMARICLAGDTPFSAICGADDGVMNAEARAVACATGNGGTSAFCGDEDTAGTYIFAYCDTAAGNTNAAYCPNTYAGAVNDTSPNLVDVSDLTDKALNADGTGLLPTFVANGKANPANDDRTNFIVSHSSGVFLGRSNVSGANAATFRLNSTSGFSVAQGSVRETVTDARQGGKSGFTYDVYYYVGVLSDTNLGKPLPAMANDGATTLEWSAQLRFMFNATVQDPQDFTLMVDLSDQTISGSVTGLLGFDIDGNFTDTGLLYGRFVSNLAGAGTLTGLIGEVGAVGIFKSNPGSGAYVGGFLADGSGNCTTTGNPFNADCKGNIDQRVQLCLAWEADGLPNGVTVKDNCAGDPAITAVICADNGANANPFDTNICKGDQDNIQTAFLANCKGNTANGADCSVHDACLLYPYGTRCDATVYGQERTSYTNLVNSCRDGITTGTACSAHDACVANPYQGGCYFGNYAKEREVYTESLLAYCSSDRTSATAPEGAPDCATPAIQADVCASSGTYANPLDAETCPVGYADLDMIQNAFTTTCYHARADLSERPECNNIATCFMAGNLANNAATSADGRVACNIAGLFDVKDLVICNGAISGGTRPVDCALETITKACLANPFSEVVSDEGIDCLSDRSLDQARNELCIGATGSQYDCTETVSRACAIDSTSKYCTETVVDNCTTDPFGDLCYGNVTHENARYTMCNAIEAQITYDAVRMPHEDSLLQNCLDAIDNECQYSEEERFVNRFCQIGTFYDVARGEACITGTAPSDAICGDENSVGVIQAYCATDAALTDLVNCPTRFATLNGDASAVTVPAIGTGQNQLLNSDGSDALTVIAANEANDANDAPTNFIGITGGDSILAAGTGTNRNGLALADPLIGFALANSATNKLYVGLLQDTTLGAPLRSGTAQTATWDATVRVISYDGATVATPANETFKLEINYGGTGDNTLAVMGTEPSVGSLGAFTIDGKFTRNGVIYGTVNFATNAGTGTLTGLIGDAGVVGIFKSDAETGATTSALAYVGGFTAAAPVPSLPKYSSFVEFYTPRSDTYELHATHPATPDAGRFIEGTPTSLVTNNFDLTGSDGAGNGNGYGPAVVRLGEVASDHPDYTSGFAVMRSNQNKYRAGLLSGTDLGASLDVNVKTNWKGKIYLLRHTVDEEDGDNLDVGDLTLTVDFAAGTINSTGTSITNGGSLTVKGRFGSVHRLPDGILFGTVDNDANRNLPLAGLIGEKGVLGIFHGGVNQLLAGGFYATPAPALPDATFATWADSFATGEPNAGTLLAENALLNDADNTSTIVTDTTPTSGTNSAHFIRGTAKGIDGIYTPFAPARVGGLHLTGDTDNGVAYGFINTDTDINDHATGLHFAGLLSGADVGAPINVQTEAFWTGSIGGFINGQAISTTNFRLRVGFNGTVGSITNSNALEDRFGTQSPVSLRGRFFAFNGTFNADGVLTGTVESSANFDLVGGRQAGTFNGIVGQAGVLGVFKSDADTTTSGVQYAGGFAVVPSGTPTAFIDEVAVPNNNGGGGGTVTESAGYIKWATSLGNDLRASGYDTPQGANSVDFIRLGAADAILATSVDDIVPGLLRLDGSTTAGVAYGAGGDIDNGIVQLYAGLLPGTDLGADTDLGAPIAQDMATAAWTGSLAGYDITGQPITTFANREFVMNVAFTGNSGTIVSNGPTFIGGAGFYTIDFRGTFDEFGVISGTANGGSGSTAMGTFNGLIGTKGAVGAFKGINPAGTQGYVGGFEVKP